MCGFESRSRHMRHCLVFSSILLVFILIRPFEEVPLLITVSTLIPGIFVKSVLPGGQAAEDGRLRAGDEVLAVNGHVCHDLAHREAVQLFRNIKSGSIALHLCRRAKHREPQ